MTIVLIFILFVLITFAYGAMFGAPYLPTQKEQIEHSLELLDLKPGQTVVDIGCGDGRFLLAAQKSGLKAIGYEINPLLFSVSILRTKKFRSDIKVLFSKVSRADWVKDVDGVYVFLMNKKMNHLENQFVGSGLKVVSYAFSFPNKKPIKTEKGLNLYQF